MLHEVPASRALPSWNGGLWRGWTQGEVGVGWCRRKQRRSEDPIAEAGGGVHREGACTERTVNMSDMSGLLDV